MSSRRIGGTLLLLAVLAAYACASSPLVDSWKDPGYAAGPLRKVLVDALAKAGLI